MSVEFSISRLKVSGSKSSTGLITMRKVEMEGIDTHVLFDTDERLIELPSMFSYHSIKSQRFSRKTIEEYLKNIKDFLIYLHNNEFTQGMSFDDYILSAAALQVEDYLFLMRTQDLAPATIHQRDASLRTFFTWLMTEEGGRKLDGKFSPYSNNKLKTKAPSKSGVKYLTYDVFIDFINHAFDNEFDRCVAHFMFDTGLRISEVKRVLFVDIENLLQGDPDQNYYKLFVRGSKGKADKIKERYTILTRATVSRLWRMVNNYEAFSIARNRYSAEELPLFIQPNLKAFSSYRFTKAIYRANVAAKGQGKSFGWVTSHMFRHSMAISVLLSEYGVDQLDKLLVVKNTHGHNALETTEIYTSMPWPVINEVKRIRASLGVDFRFQESEEILTKTSLRYETNKRRYTKVHSC
jgi:integrase/recombinase XerD